MYVWGHYPAWIYDPAETSFSEKVKVSFRWCHLFHDAIKNADAISSPFTNACPYMYFHRMFWPTCEIKWKLLIILYNIIHVFRQYYILQLAYLDFGLGAWPTFQQQNRLWFSSWTVHSSDHITSSSKSSSWFSTDHANPFTLFASLIIWQYALPLNVQPRLEWHLHVWIEYQY